MPRRNDRLEALRARLDPKAQAVARVLATAEGQVLMKALEDEFLGDGDLKARPGEGAPLDVNETLVNLGAAEVVLYLRALVNFHTKRSTDA